MNTLPPNCTSNHTQNRRPNRRWVSGAVRLSLGVVAMVAWLLAVTLGGRPLVAQGRLMAPARFPAQAPDGPDQTATNTTLTMPSSVLLGQTVTLTARVTATAGTPGGNVSFYEAGSPLAAVRLGAQGVATWSTAGLLAGTHPITAVYQGAAGYAASTSALRIVGVYTRPALSAGSLQTCKVRSDGTLSCWGTIPGWYFTFPVPMPNPNADWLQVRVGVKHWCGLKADGVTYCWGETSDDATAVPGPNMDWVQLSNGNYHSCGLRANGAIACWGYYFALSHPVPNPNINWVRMDSGNITACGIKTDSTMTCWGVNSRGEGNVPAPNRDWIEVEVDYFHACGIKKDRTLVCWGDNSSGQTTIPAPNANWVQVTAGFDYTCGLRSDHTVACWGLNSNGQTTVPSPNANWVQVTAGNAHTCGLKASGQVVCWGRNDAGQAPTISVVRSANLILVVGQAYQEPLTVVGGTSPYTISVVGGALPPGMTLASGIVLSGTPTAAGVFSFTVRAEDVNNIASTRTTTVTVRQAAIAMSVAPGVLVANGISASLLLVTPTIDGVLQTGRHVELVVSPAGHFDSETGPRGVLSPIGDTGVVTRWVVAGNTAPVTAYVTATLNVAGMVPIVGRVPVRLVPPASGLIGQLQGVFQGGVLTYTWTVTNLGPQPATGVCLSVSLPANVQMMGGPTGGVVVGSAVEYSATAMGVGETHVMRYVAAPLLRVGDIVVSAEASSDTSRYVGVGDNTIYRVHLLRIQRP